LAPQRFQELFLPHFDAAYSLARFIARDAVAADDIVQESFLRAFRSFSSYRGGDAKAWLLAIVRNCAFDWSKHRAAAAGSLDALDPDQLAGAQESPDTSIQRGDEIALVRALIHRLPEPFRATLVLRELEELSYKQIAQVTGVPMGTVMSRLARARQMLANELESTP
jgi:RNA polymerase sigma-70 factor (ECF subfamily)